MTSITHAKAAIVSMGDELTLGQTLDTNSRWLSRRLMDLGIVPVEHVTVPDDLDATVRAFRRLAESVDLIISTGGLGPTADDLTRPALAAATDDHLIEDAESLRQIQVWFQSRGRVMSPLNQVQAQRPARGLAIENKNGTAPGLQGRIEIKSAASGSRACDVFCLPGPPSEMIPMFDGFVAARLAPPAGRVVRTRVLHTVGIGESDLAAKLGELMDRSRNPLVGTTASGGIVSIRIRYEGASASGATAQADSIADHAAAEAGRRAGAFVFGSAEETLAGVVVDRLRKRGERLAVVESCTGGMLGELVTDVPGSSDVFWGGWITYANQTKRSQVGVPMDLFGETGRPEAPGAVSREVAIAMAVGGLERAGVDHCLAITGVAGPGGGTAAKPVGTVWIARASRTVTAVQPSSAATGPEIDARRFNMAGDRRAVREWSARTALAMLYFAITGQGGQRLLRQVE